LRVLIVEDSPEDGELLLVRLRRGGFSPDYLRVFTPADMAAALALRQWDLVISDHNMPQFSSEAALQVLQASGHDLPFIILSGSIGEDVAVAAMKAGAHDYILKGNPTRLVPAIERELREAEVRRARRQADAARADEAAVAQALARVGRELIACVDTPAVLARLCQLVTEVLPCDVSRAWLRCADPERFVAIATHGDASEQWEALRAAPLPAAVLAPLTAALQHDNVLWPTTSAQHAAAQAALQGLACSAFATLRRGAELNGMLVAGFHHDAPGLTAVQQRILEGVAQVGSLALENARLVEQLDRANRLKSDFLATMSHELRTPLHIMMGFNDLVREGEFGPVQREQAEALATVDTHAKNLLALINATLDVSRLEAGQLPVDRRIVDLAAVLDEIDDESIGLHRKPQLTLARLVAPALPQLTTDPVKLKVIVRNLLDNAVKFTDQGGITLRAAPSGEGVEIAVSDTGIGIEAAVLPVVFEAFRQGDSSMTRQHGGIGLGLSVARRLTELLGGSLTVESEIGRGSTFRVWLPAQPPSDPRAPNESRGA
jgi:signal transduction histidine kinase/FixJ family two-component response regulator